MNTITTIPFTLTRKLDSNCYRVFAVCMNIRNSTGHKRFNASEEMLSYFTGSSRYIIKASLSALIADRFLLIGDEEIDENGITVIRPWGKDKYEINDVLLEKYMKMTFDEVRNEPQTRTTSFRDSNCEWEDDNLSVMDLKRAKRKERKSDIISEHLDIEKTIDENLDLLNSKGIDVKRATVAVVLAAMRREAGYTPPNRKPRQDGFTVLDRKMQEMSKSLRELHPEEGKALLSELENVRKESSEIPRHLLTPNGLNPLEEMDLKVKKLEEKISRLENQALSEDEE